MPAWIPTTSYATSSKARADGVDITGNSYPYETGWTYLTQSLPAWAQEGNSAAIVARLQKPDTRARILTELKDHDFYDFEGGFGKSGV